MLAIIFLHSLILFGQQKLRKKVSPEVDEDDLHATVIETATGRVLSGDDAPLESQVQGWLEMHPGWARAPREDQDDSDLSEVDDEDRAGLAVDKLSKEEFGFPCLLLIEIIDKYNACVKKPLKKLKKSLFKFSDLEMFRNFSQ